MFPHSQPLTPQSTKEKEQLVVHTEHREGWEILSPGLAPQLEKGWNSRERQGTWELTGLPTSCHGVILMTPCGNKSSLHENRKPSSHY